MKAEYIVMIVIAGLLCLAAAVIGDTLTQYRRELQACHSHTHEGWEPPAIPQCDKELWLRITEGCEDET